MHLNIPLNNVHVKADILDGLAKVVLTCNFTNSNTIPVNPVHFFSLDYNATLNKLSMQIGERILTSVTKEKNDAKREYSNAVKSGHKASIIEQLSDNDYKLQVGNINFQENVNVIIEYVTTLECNQNGSYIFTFPTNISVKYFPERNMTHIDDLYSREMKNMTYSDNVPYNYTFLLNWTSSNNILGIEAPSDLCLIEHNDNKVCIKSIGHPSKGNFTVAIKTEHKPCVYYYEDEFTKDIYTLTTIRVDSPAEILTDRLKKDFRIIVDCSGSMTGKFNYTTKMKATEEAVIKFLNMINTEDYFNITFFGSTYQRLLPSSIRATKESIYFASQKILKIGASLGGTELFDCLHDSIINTENLDNVQCEKIVVIFTDGQIGNYIGLTNEIEKHYNFCNHFSSAMKAECKDEKEITRRLVNNRFRIFTVGIGNDVDRKLIKKLADITGGLYVYAKDSIRMDLTLEYIVRNINAKYYLNARLASETESTKTYSAMYPNKNYIFIRKFSQHQIGNLEENGLTLLCENSKTNARVRCNIKFNKFVKKGIELKQLYTTILIKNLEHSLEFDELNYTEYQNTIKNVVDLSIKENIMSKYTSFLIIDDEKTTFVPSVDTIIQHYSENHVIQSVNSNRMPCMEEVDYLEGGMDMFGGGGRGHSAYHTGEKDFIPYQTEISRENVIHNLNNVNEFGMMCVNNNYICYKSNNDLTNCASKLSMVVELYYNIIMYFELMKHNDLQDHAYQLLCAICKFSDILTPFDMLKVKEIHKCYISQLITENNTRIYRYYPERSSECTGDY